MARYEVCGNDYDMAIKVVAAGVRHTFDCFECTIHAMASLCEQCNCKVLGHGIQVGGRFFCSVHREVAQADVCNRVA